MCPPVSLLLLPALAAALLLAAPVAANAPTKETSTVTFGPFVDDETCAFPFTVTVERTRRTTYFDNGDIERHTELIVKSSANGKTVVGRNAFNVFIEADAPTEWVITWRLREGAAERPDALAAVGTARLRLRNRRAHRSASRPARRGA